MRQILVVVIGMAISGVLSVLVAINVTQGRIDKLERSLDAVDAEQAQRIRRDAGVAGNLVVALTKAELIRPIGRASAQESADFQPSHGGGAFSLGPVTVVATGLPGIVA